MTTLPRTFRAYVAEHQERDGAPAVDRGVREFAGADLPDGEVEVRVTWSSVNFKDGLAVRPDGKVARISPLIPGIDLAGEVVASSDPSIAMTSQPCRSSSSVSNPWPHPRSTARPVRPSRWKDARAHISSSRGSRSSCSS